MLLLPVMMTRLLKLLLSVMVTSDAGQCQPVHTSQDKVVQTDDNKFFLYLNKVEEDFEHLDFLELEYRNRVVKHPT